MSRHEETHYDGDKLVSRSLTVDNGDGTATRTVYDPDGNETATERIDLPPAPPVDPMQVVLDAVAALGPEALLQAIGVAGGVVEARATFVAAQTASATTAARSVATALVGAVDAGKAAAEEAADLQVLSADIKDGLR